MDKVNRLTTLIDNCYRVLQKDDKGGWYLSLELIQGLQDNDLQYAKDLLVLYRQYELFIRYLIVTKISV